MIDDLIVLINKIQTDNHDVILTIDANEQFESGKGGVAKLISMTKLVDPIAYTHGLQNMPHIYQRGSKKNRFHFYLSKNIQVYTSLRYHYIQSSIPIRPPRYVHRRRLETFITKQIPKQYRTIKQVVTIKRYQTSNKIKTNSLGVRKTARHYSTVTQNKRNRENQYTHQQRHDEDRCTRKSTHQMGTRGWGFPQENRTSWTTVSWPC